MKYIDAEKLIAEIERQQRRLILLSNTEQVDMRRDCAIQNGVYDNILGIITSLQQEQPEGLHFTPLNRLIQKIPSENWNDTVNNYAKKLRDCLIKEGYLKDAGVLQGYISYMNGNNVPMATMDELDQPDMGLEEAIDEYYHKNLGFIISFIDTRIIVEHIARHFWNKGYNARKEVIK